MKKLGQKGFGAGEAIVIVVIIAALVGVGWFVWSKQKDKDNTSDTSKTSTQNSGQNNTNQPGFNLPANYTSHTDSKYGFSLAYPQEWGKLSDPDDPATRGFVMVTPYINNLPVELAWIQGKFGYAVANKKDFRVAVEKNGPAVVYTSHNGLPVWRVVDQADGTGYRVGDNYPVKSSKNAHGVTVYEFHWTDEGMTHGRWIFETKDKFVTVELPALLRPERAPVTDSELKTYFDIADNIRNSIKLENN